jgi:hypothetical protein
VAVISRESSAPIVDGEEHFADSVELEFQKIFALVGTSGAGTMDTANFSRNANIVGTQFANTTITGAKFASDTIQTGKMIEAAVPKAAFEVANNSGNMTGSGFPQDVDGISTATLTPGSTNDIVTMSLAVTIGPDAQAFAQYAWGFNIDDGTGDVIIGVSEFTGANSEMTRVYRYVMTATAASATVYKPRYGLVSGTAGNWKSGLDYNAVFHVHITPIK